MKTGSHPLLHHPALLQPTTDTGRWRESRAWAARSLHYTVTPFLMLFSVKAGIFSLSWKIGKAVLIHIRSWKAEQLKAERQADEMVQAGKLRVSYRGQLHSWEGATTFKLRANPHSPLMSLFSYSSAVAYSFQVVPGNPCIHLRGIHTRHLLTSQCYFTPM